MIELLKKNKNTFIIVGIIAAIIISGTVLLLMQEKTYQWHPQFRTSKNEPYDLSLFKNTISNSYQRAKYSEINSLIEDTSYIAAQNAIVVYVSATTFLDSLSIDKLMRSANNGNKIFISTHTPKAIINQAFGDCKNSMSVKYVMAKNIYPSIKNGSARPKINFQVREDVEREPWYYFTTNICNAFPANILGSFEVQNEDYYNFLELPFGKGGFYIHLTPLIFTNFHFKNDDVFSYTNELFKTMPHEKLFYYIPKHTTPSTASSSEQPYVSEKGILQFILNNPPLKWAWYLILSLALVYVLNTMRRNQRAIPIIELPQNETANYLDVVSRLYQKEVLHKHIIQVQEKLIFEHLRQKYRINLINATAETYRTAAQKLEMDEVYVKRFFHILNRDKNNSNLTNKEFKETIHLINEFYSKCP